MFNDVGGLKYGLWFFLDVITVGQWHTSCTTHSCGSGGPRRTRVGLHYNV